MSTDIKLNSAFEVLRNGQDQLDEDGIKVGVSRQALDEVLEEYARCADHIDKLRDFAIWMTGCCEMTQHEYFLKNRYLLSEPPIFIEGE